MSIARNTAYNSLGALLPVAVSLVTVPLYLQRIGAARYGVLAVAWVLLGYFGVFDFGLGRAMVQRIAALSSATAEDRANSFWTALVLNAALGSFGAILLWPVAHLVFLNTVDGTDPLRSELFAGLPWLALALPIATLTGPLSGALQGRQLFFAFNAVSVVGTVLFQCLPLAVATFWSPRLDIVLPASVLARGLTVVGLYIVCRYELLRVSARFDRAEARTLIGFGGWITVSAFAAPLMTTLDRVLIGAWQGPAAVSQYVVPFQLAERLTILPSAFSSALFPRLAGASEESRQRQSRVALAALAQLMTPAAAAGVLALPTFLSLWINPDFAARSALTGQILVIGWWASSLTRVPLAHLQAQGRPDLVAKCQLGELVPYLGLLWGALTYFGFEGAALAFGIRTLVEFVLLAWLARPLGQALLTILLRLGLLVATAAYAIFFAQNTAALALGLFGSAAMFLYHLHGIVSRRLPHQ